MCCHLPIQIAKQRRGLKFRADFVLESERDLGKRAQIGLASIQLLDRTILPLKVLVVLSENTPQLCNLSMGGGGRGRRRRRRRQRHRYRHRRGSACDALTRRSTAARSGRVIDMMM
jgi:hypothetical protein